MSAADAAPAADGGSGLLRFALPAIVANPDAWGPVGVPTQFEKAPFAMFNKYDRLGKCADFGSYTRGGYRRYGRGEENVELGYKFDVEEAKEFNVVESKSRTAKAGGEGGPPRSDYRRGPAGGAAASAVGGAGTKGYDDRMARGGVASRRTTGPAGGRDDRRGGPGGFGGGPRRFGGPGGPMSGPTRVPSVAIQEDWLELESVDLTTLHKLSTPPPTEKNTRDILWAGALHSYDDEYDRMTLKTSKKLRRYEDRDFYVVTGKEDPHLGKLLETAAGAADDDEEEEDGAVKFDASQTGNVFATEAVLSHLMSCTRSVTPWDLVFTYLPGGLVFIDVRDEAKRSLELPTVNETAHTPPPINDGTDDINCKEILALEAADVATNFSQQVLKAGAEAPLPAEPSLAPHPYYDSETEAGRVPASLAYRYRRFALTPDIVVVARTVINAVNRKRGTPQYLSVFALHEWDHRLSGTTEWRKSLDLQRGNVIASEVKNNSHRVAKYTLQALLAGADTMRLGFVSRASRTDNDAHVILGTHSLVPTTFAAQVNLNVSNAWGILKWAVETVRKHARNLQEDVPDDTYMAKFVLLRDPIKPAVKLFNVPNDAFENDGEEEGGLVEGAEDGEEASGWGTGAAGAASGDAAE